MKALTFIFLFTAIWAYAQPALPGLIRIETGERVVRDAQGGDFGGNLVYVMADSEGNHNLYIKSTTDKVVARALSRGQNINLAPNYCAANDRIAFQHFNGKNFDIGYLEADNDSEEELFLLTNTDENEFNPAWDREGTRVVFEKGVATRNFLSRAGGSKRLRSGGKELAANQMYLIDLAKKSGEVQALGKGSFPKFSPDNKYIAYIKYELDGSLKHEIGTLWVLPRDGSPPHQLTQASLGYVSHPAWSPDSKQLIFTLTTTDKPDADLYVLDLSGDNLRQLTFEESTDFAPYWSAENEVYFTSDRESKPGQFSIWRFKIE
ncbi:TolB family protein [Persicitalea jodogahamensis]|uniref:Uncharacterized protein n=1 Tax=Persicitalea jodogahamensis TaxID=402147 RepID=A0A8J3D057_9BACT|nr:PD40 domain-containing protein [Persicitalea jodogahamensis]GHB52061.1 hypothetical protein GCM10007390_00840 [Persicitalea jodogahamensis]